MSRSAAVRVAQAESRAAGAFVPGPRQEYIDAFDDDHSGAGAPGVRKPVEDVGGPFRAEDDDEAPGGHETAGPRTKGKGRTFTSVAAAAVTTVLAVVVGGHVADGGPDRSASPALGDVPRQDTDDVSRSHHRPTPAEPSPTPLSYEQQMAARYPLDAKLAGPGDFRTVGGRDEAPGSGSVVRYRVDVEKGLPLDGELFVQAVHRTLNDERSWGHGGARTFERVSSGDADWVITLASPGTTAVWCAKSGLDTTVSNVSCDSASTPRIMINAYRWAQGAETFGDEMFAYRQMLINHEVGHRLGRGHESCSRSGALAPVMMQQTKYLSTDGAVCRPNPWPFPKG